MGIDQGEGEDILDVVARLPEGNGLDPDVHGRTSQLPSPTVGAMLPGIVAGGGQGQGAVVTAQQPSNVVAAERDVDGWVVEIVGAGLRQAGPPGRQPCGAGQHLQNAPGVGHGLSLGRKRAFLAGEGQQHRQGHIGVVAAALKQWQVEDGKPERQVIPEFGPVGGVNGQDRVADALHPINGGAALPRRQPRQDVGAPASSLAQRSARCSPAL